MIEIDKSDVQEQLLRLYLRLNGFFTSGFIVHSPTSSKNKTEIDTIAVRFPYSREPERGRGPDESLGLSGARIELAICEAKTKPRFNEALYGDSEAVATLLRWAGLFRDSDLHELVPKVQAILTPESQPKPVIRKIEVNDIVVRSLLFCAEQERPRHNQP